MIARRLPTLQLERAVDAEALAEALGRMSFALPPDYLRRQRWFGSKSKEIVAVGLRDHAVQLPAVLLAIFEVAFTDGSGESYCVPLSIRSAQEVASLAPGPGDALLVAESPAGSALVYDALADPAFCRDLFDRIARGRALPGRAGSFDFVAAGKTGQPDPSDQPPERIRLLKAEQSNSSVVYDDRYILKCFRRLQDDRNPDVEVSLFLTARTSFTHTPPLAGYVEYVGASGFRGSIAALQRFIPNAGDGWAYTLAHLEASFQRALVLGTDRLTEPDIVSAVASFSSSYLQDVRRLGRITGQLHNALASDPSDQAFAPEPATTADLAAWAAGMSANAAGVLDRIQRSAPAYPGAVQKEIRALVARGGEYLARVEELATLDLLPVKKIRYHGDFHLGQVLRTDSGFVIIDFEGEPARPLAQRRARHLALKDVAGMLRSFNYAGHAALRRSASGVAETPFLRHWAAAWEALAVRGYLDGYFEETLAGPAPFLPRSRAMAERAVAIFSLDKAIYELDYEANNRPEWLLIPLSYLLAQESDRHSR